MIEWLNNLHPAVNALVVGLSTIAARLALAATVRSCWRASRRLFGPRDPNKMECNEHMRERINPRSKECPKDIGETVTIQPVTESMLKDAKAAIEKMTPHETREALLRSPVPFFDPATPEQQLPQDEPETSIASRRARRMHDPEGKKITGANGCVQFGRPHKVHPQLLQCIHCGRYITAIKENNESWYWESNP